MQHLHDIVDVVRRVLLSHSVVILCSSFKDKILKEQNTNSNKLQFVLIFSLKAQFIIRKEIAAKVAENNSPSL